MYSSTALSLTVSPTEEGLKLLYTEEKSAPTQESRVLAINRVVKIVYYGIPNFMDQWFHCAHSSYTSIYVIRYS